jgi:hypothetical protein
VYLKFSGGHVVAYEVVERSFIRVETPALTLSPSNAKIVLNAAATRIMADAGVKHVNLLWDKTTHAVAVRDAPKQDPNAYALSIHANNRQSAVAAVAFFRHIGWNSTKRITVEATWNAATRMLEATIPQEYLAKKKVESLRRA